MKVIASNKKAHYNYFIEKKFEAGIELKGSEIKSIRNGSVNLIDSYAKISIDMQCYVINMHISNYKHMHKIEVLDERRQRKLLLHKSEITKMKKLINEQRYTLIPTKLYFKDNKVKLEIALAKGKQNHDKRQTLKEKDIKREMQKSLKY